jgi:hypothetical protein
MSRRENPHTADTAVESSYENFRIDALARGGGLEVKRSFYVIAVGLLWLMVGIPTAQANHDCFGVSGSHGDGGGNLFTGGSTNNTWSGLGGDDSADGNAGLDRLCGDDGGDGLSSAPDGGYFLGGSDDDKIDGGAGRDIIKGEGGADRLEARAGADDMWGLDGNDYLDGGVDSDNDEYHGGAGTSDTCVSHFGDTYFADCEIFV